MILAHHMPAHHMLAHHVRPGDVIIVGRVPVLVEAATMVDGWVELIAGPRTLFLRPTAEVDVVSSSAGSRGVR